MYVVSIKLSFKIFDAFSLKDKRQVVKSIQQRVRNKFNVSITEVSENDVHNLAVMGISIVSNSLTLANKMIDDVVKFIEENYGVEILMLEEY